MNDYDPRYLAGIVVTSGCCAPAVSGQYAYYGTGVISPGDQESLNAFQHVTAPREKGITGAMHAVDLSTGKSVWHFATGWALDITTGNAVWKSFIPVTIESLSWHGDRLYVRNPNWVVELDSADGKRLRVGYASWGWGGLAFTSRHIIQSGIQSQYGTSGGTILNLEAPGKELNRTIPTMENVRCWRANL